jgi:hypothetical protein
MAGHFEKGVWIEDKIIVEIWRYHSKDDEVKCNTLEEALNLYRYSDNCAMYCFINEREIPWEKVEALAKV